LRTQDKGTREKAIRILSSLGELAVAAVPADKRAVQLRSFSCEFS